MRRHFVYALSDPRTGEIKYIGKTSQGLKKRYGQHSHVRERDRPLYRWWDSLLLSGVRPKMDPIEECQSSKHASEREIAIIAQMKSDGLILLNSTSGGEGIASEERGKCGRHGEYEVGVGCIECKRECFRKWSVVNLDKNRERVRRWYEAHREAHRDRYRKWRKENLDMARERDRESKRKWRALKKAEKLASTQAQPVAVA